MLVLIGIVSILLCAYVLNKFNILAKILLQIFIVMCIVTMLLHKSNSIIDGMICVGVSWSLIAITKSKSIWDTILHLFWFICGAWLVSFVIGIIDMFSGGYAEMIRVVSILGLGIAILRSFSSEGRYLAFSSDPDSIYDGWSTASDNNEEIIVEKSLFGNDNIYKDKSGNILAKGEKNIFGEEVIRNNKGNKVAQTERTLFGEMRYNDKNYQTIGKKENVIFGNSYIKDKDGNTTYEVENGLFGNRKKIKKK